MKTYKLYAANAQPGTTFPLGSDIPSPSCLDASDATFATLVYDQHPEISEPRTVVVAEYGGLPAFDPTLTVGFVAYARWSWERPGHQFGANAGLCTVDISGQVPGGDPIPGVNEIVQYENDLVAFYGSTAIAQTYAAYLQGTVVPLNHFFDTKFATLSGEVDVAHLHSSWIEITTSETEINARKRGPVRVFS